MLPLALEAVEKHLREASTDDLQGALDLFGNCFDPDLGTRPGHLRDLTRSELLVMALKLLIDEEMDDRTAAFDEIVASL